MKPVQRITSGSFRTRSVIIGAMLLFAAPFSTTLSARLTAQSNAERVLNNRYTRSHDYDLVHERIELRNFNWDSTSFDGRVALTIVARREGMDSLILDAGALLSIGNTTQRRGAGAAGGAGAGGAARATTLRTARHGDTLVAYLSPRVAFGDTFNIAIDYHGKVSNGRGLTFLNSDGRPHRPRQIWSQGEDMDNHFWFPTYDFPNDKATWELIATVPREYTAVSNGNLVTDVMNANGTRTMHWTETKPNATYLVSLVVAPLTKVHDVWRGKPVDYYVYNEDASIARGLFGITPDMIQVYSDLTGVAYPWEKYAQTTVADFFGGMENVSATTLVDWIPDARAYRDRPWYQWILIPHELAHQWFGDYVTTEDWAHTWLNEGFAEYMPGAYWRTRKGEAIAQDYFVDEYNQFMAIDAQQRMPVVTPGSNNIYPKGALVIEMLRNYLGDKPFWSSINHYLKSHALDNATTDDLRQAILDATGQNLDWFFDQWLYQAGYPAFKVETKYDAATSRLTLIATQTQTSPSENAAPGDASAQKPVQFTTPLVFRMPVTVRVGTTGGDVTATSWIDQRVDTIVVDNVRSAPTMVVFDDGNRILKTLDFAQPTAWLATQLERDTNLWDRQWIIAQLAKTRDAASIAAISKEGVAADYFLTRVQAARALGGVGAAAAVPALRPMLRDTSSQVRAAAVAALGRVGGADAFELIRQSLSDSSYAVQAAAVSAAVRADSLHSADIVRKALQTPSYRDDIRNAALLSAGTTGDPALVPGIVAMLGDDVRAAIALGRFAAKGNDAASQALTAALNDKRAWVRGWAVTGFGNMPPALALPRLQAALAGITYDDTRAQVTQLIAQLQSRQGR